ncbi:Protein of unknown function [Gryllus bimaculatus]|nr:Protein of unknown function [Gryllus bimaculatus]
MTWEKVALYRGGEKSELQRDPAAPPCPTPELQFRPSGRYSPLPPLF